MNRKNKNFVQNHQFELCVNSEFWHKLVHLQHRVFGHLETQECQRTDGDLYGNWCHTKLDDGNELLDINVSQSSHLGSGGCRSMPSTRQWCLVIFAPKGIPELGPNVGPNSVWRNMLKMLISWKTPLNSFQLHQASFMPSLAKPCQALAAICCNRQGLVNVPFWGYWTSPKIVAI